MSGFHISRHAHGWLLQAPADLQMRPSFVEILGLVEGGDHAGEADARQGVRPPHSLVVILMRPDQAREIGLAVAPTLIVETLARSLQPGARAVTVLLRELEQGEFERGLQDVHAVGRASIREPFWLTTQHCLVPAERRAELAASSLQPDGKRLAPST